MAYRMYSHFGPPCQDIKRNKHEGAFVIKGMKIHQW